MDRNPLRTPVVEYDEVAVMDVVDEGDGVSEAAVGAGGRLIERTPARKTRSLSDGGCTPQKFAPAAHLVDARRTSKDDSSITIPIRDSLAISASAANSTAPAATTAPVTPHRSVFPTGLHLQLPTASPPTQQSATLYPKPAPLSPKVDHSQIYSSPTNILPRRSRGLDFSRAATSLHHTTLAEQASPDSSPTIGGRAMNIPGRRPGEFGAPEQTSNSLWSIMGNHERHHISNSLGSAANLVSDDSSDSDDEMMDDDMDEPYLMTPQAVRNNPLNPHSGSAFPIGSGSPAVNSLLSFQQRQRPRKQPKKKVRAPLGIGFPSTPGNPSILSKSPPANMSPYNSMAKEIASPHTRRESISWAANQLNISGSESEDSPKPGVNVDEVLGPGMDGQNRVVRRAVTRRSNLLPKSRNFARVKLALAEEGTPVESEFRRESEVIRQVRESDMDTFESPRPTPLANASTSVTATTHPSPSVALQDSLEDSLSEDAMMMVDNSNPMDLSSSFKQQAQKNSKGRVFWDTFSETGSVGGSGSGSGARTTPPPVPRGSMSMSDDMSMDSPSLNAGPSGQNGFIFPMTTTPSSGGEGTPQPSASGSSSMPPGSGAADPHPPPSAAEITRRFNMGKRRRDDDLDPVQFKRRAVSPGMSVHNSPIMQSPMQHSPWGPRPGSNGDKSGNGTPSENGAGGSGEKRPSASHKGRVGYQGMVDTNDGITRLSIE